MFDEYWADVRGQVEAVPLEWERVERGQTVEARGKLWRVDWVRFSSVADALVWGWIAAPLDRPVTKAGFLWLPGYSYGTPPPDQTNLVRGAVTLCINVHGNKPDEPYVNPAGKNDYITQGLEDPRTYILRGICAHSLMAVKVLAAQPQVDTVSVGGMSQGGCLALICAAQSRTPKLCFADMPFLCDVRRALSVSHSLAYRALTAYVKKHPEALATVELFDPLLHAPLISIPTWMSAGGRDPNSRPQTVEAVFGKLGSKLKEYRLFPEAGHVFLPEMNATYESWIDNMAAGESGNG